MTLENSNSKKKGICSSPNTARSRYGNNLRITVAANQGGRKYMEDRVQIETFRREDGSIRFTFLGVFDGHGGAEASEYVRMHLLNNIMSSDLFDSNDDDEFLEAIRLGFLMTHHMIWKVVPDWPPTASGYPSTAGTTVSVAFIKNGKLYTGHVGDSAIILGKRTFKSVHNQLVPERLTVDHKPENEEEQTRIRLAGGSVAMKSGVTRVVWTRPLKGRAGPIRRNSPTESIPFLAVARSLGDVWSYCETTQEFVVSPDPDLAVRELTAEDACLVLASDGLTNVMAPLQVTMMVDEEEGLSKRAAETPEDDGLNREKHTNHSRVLVANSLRNWRNLRADNISAITVIFDSPFSELWDDESCVEERIDDNQSIDRVLIEDPECMVRISPEGAQKLATFRTPIIYQGALDANFSTVNYRGPGFMTHEEEQELEEKYNEMMMKNGKEVESEKLDRDVTPDITNVSEISLTKTTVCGSNIKNSIEITRITPEKAGSKSPIARGSRSLKRVGAPRILNSLSESEKKQKLELEKGLIKEKVLNEPSPTKGVQDSNSHPISCSVDDYEGTDEEEPIKMNFSLTKMTKIKSPDVSLKTNKTSNSDSKAKMERRITRSIARAPNKISPRPIAIAVRKSVSSNIPTDVSLSTPTQRRGPARRAVLDVENKMMTPSGTLDIKIRVEGAASPSYGMITRSRDRSSTTLLVDVRTPASQKLPEYQTPATSRVLPSTKSNRKRSRRISPGPSAGVTPIVQRLTLESPDLDPPKPRMRSAPSTPAKVANNSSHMGSKWSLSKLDTIGTEVKMDGTINGEPPSKMRRIYGFMRRLVGFGLGGQQ